MRYGLDVPINGRYADIRLLAEIAVEAEEAGWDGFFLQDVFSGDEDILDPWLALVAIALRTTAIRIGIMVTPLPRRLPWEVARQVATIDQLSGGRIVFAAGLGYRAEEMQALGLEPALRLRAGQVDEALEILRGLWTGRPFTFKGSHYRVDELQVRPVPRQQPRPPVWVAAGWPARPPFRRAARWDGAYLMTVNQSTNRLLTPGEVIEIGAYLRAHREPSAPPIDLAVNAITEGEGRTDPGEMERAGATWWVDWDRYPSIDDYRARIRSGPPA